MPAIVGAVGIEGCCLRMGGGEKDSGFGIAFDTIVLSSMVFYFFLVVKIRS
jgi:hypothetical protein